MGNMKNLAGYAAGIIAGAAYGANALFGKNLIADGVSVTTILFFRYLFATVFMAMLVLARKESFRLDRKQFEWVLVLGLLYSSSSLTLFEAYKYIPAGLATTVVYLYPVFTALIMVVLRQMPSWQSWVSIAASLLGVFIMIDPLGEGALSWTGILLSGASAFSYSLYLVTVNQARRLHSVSAHTITFYALVVGSALFFLYRVREGGSIIEGLDARNWMDLASLGLIPTMVAMLALAVATKSIGPTRTAVLGVSEPLTAIAIGTLVFAEPLTWNIAGGVLLCIAAILFMVLSGRTSSSATSP